VKYLLDTNICGYIIRNEPMQVLARLRQLSPNDIGLPAIALFELRHGAHRRQSASLLESVSRFAHRFDILPFDDAAAESAAAIRARLEAKDEPIGPYDLLIAGQALSRNLILVTNNEREFTRVRDLKVENWLVKK
jgi:tRNA(fMet)-specific endonuclease VapC